VDVDVVVVVVDRLLGRTLTTTKRTDAAWVSAIGVVFFQSWTTDREPDPVDHNYAHVHVHVHVGR
jgi:hypothetical protein